MRILKDLHPERVLYYFEEICTIPHGSGNTKAISDYCVSFAKDHDLVYRQDEANNVIIWKKASVGYEAAPTVILQGHLDMVCEKSATCVIDMKTEGLKISTDSQWIWAEGTTLGGDNGIAVAMALALLEDEDLEHPNLEVVLTVDEEIGMLGAVALDMSDLEGRMMLNLDSEEEGVLTVSCAGGITASCHVPVERETADGVCVSLSINGLTGGHSGVEIHKGRANASVLMGRLLYGLSREMALRIVSLQGGQADNAIASSCSCILMVPEEEITRLEAITEAYQEVFRLEFLSSDPGLCLTATTVPGSQDTPLTMSATLRVISALMLLPNGVQRMSADISGLVQTSLNLGILKLHEQEATMTFAVRSSVATEKAMLCNRIDCLASLLGGFVCYSGDYPGWEYKRDSKLRQLVANVYKQQTGKEAVIEAIHAGLECGIFAGRLQGLDCVSLGPDMRDIHSPKERLSVMSVARTWKLVCEVLRQIKEC